MPRIGHEEKLFDLILDLTIEFDLGASALHYTLGPVIPKSTPHVCIIQLEATSDELIGCTMIVICILATSLWTGLAYYLMTQSVKRNRHVFTAAFNPLIIFFSMCWEVQLTWAGAVLVIIGLYFILWAKANDLWMQKLVKDGFIIRKQTKIHSKTRARRMNIEAKRAKNKASRERKNARREERLGLALGPQDKAPAAAPPAAVSQPAQVTNKSKKNSQ
ncbi:hypothetical protein QQ045_015367 [Rhodiola kirilowii]